MTGPAKLRRFLRDRKLTQQAFAALAKVPRPQVSLWARRKRKPGPDSIAKIRKATGGLITFDDWIRSPPRRRPRAA